MKYFLLILIAFLPLSAKAITGDDTRFDWSLGQPAITADNTNTCNDTAQARFDWVLGQPAIVHDATANCTATVSSGTTYKVILPAETKMVLPAEYKMIIQ